MLEMQQPDEKPVLTEEVEYKQQNNNEVEFPNTRGMCRPRFECAHCEYSSTWRHLLLRHLKRHCVDRPKRCGVCERSFKTAASLRNHTNTHTGAKPHSCKECDRHFTTSGQLSRHIKYKHTHERPYKCTECNYASVELSKLRRHIRCHNIGERIYQCPHCTYASPDTFMLTQHMRTHTSEKPYKCEYCEKFFARPNSLQTHERIHFSAKPVYACEVCPTTCTRKRELRIHVRRFHTSGRPHECKVCGKSFPDRYSCNVHTKTHKDEKYFKCSVCPYASTTRRLLKSHMFRHTNEKPFTCDECDASFKQRHLLRSHQNLYHRSNLVPTPTRKKSHKCDECNKQFAYKGNLIRHMAVKHRAVHDPEKKRIMCVEDAPLEQREEGSGEDATDPIIKKDITVSELQTIISEDGKRHVVIEVIQLQDGTEIHLEYPRVEDNAVAESQHEDQRGSPGLNADHIMNPGSSAIQIERDSRECEQREEGSGEDATDPIIEKDITVSELQTIISEDGKRHVVIEVIQLQDGTEIHLEYPRVEDNAVAESQHEDQRGSPGLNADHIMNPGSSAIQIERDSRECEQREEGSGEEATDPIIEKDITVSEPLTIISEDGQRHVVIEVIQLQDGIEIHLEYPMVEDNAVAESQHEEQRGSPGLNADHIMNPGSSAIQIERDSRKCEEQEPEEDEVH